MIYVNIKLGGENFITKRIKAQKVVISLQIIYATQICLQKWRGLSGMRWLCIWNDQVLCLCWRELQEIVIRSRLSV